MCCNTLFFLKLNSLIQQCALWGKGSAERDCISHQYHIHYTNSSHRWRNIIYIYTHNRYSLLMSSVTLLSFHVHIVVLILQGPWISINFRDRSSWATPWQSLTFRCPNCFQLLPAQPYISRAWYFSQVMQEHPSKRALPATVEAKWLKWLVVKQMNRTFIAQRLQSTVSNLEIPTTVIIVMD